MYGFARSVQNIDHNKDNIEIHSINLCSYYNTVGHIFTIDTYTLYLHMLQMHMSYNSMEVITNVLRHFYVLRGFNINSNQL